jgi:hypothetical protein
MQDERVSSFPSPASFLPSLLQCIFLFPSIYLPSFLPSFLPSIYLFIAPPSFPFPSMYQSVTTQEEIV